MFAKGTDLKPTYSPVSLSLFPISNFKFASTIVHNGHFLLLSPSIFQNNFLGDNNCITIARNSVEFYFVFFHVFVLVITMVITIVITMVITIVITKKQSIVHPLINFIPNFIRNENLFALRSFGRIKPN